MNEETLEKMLRHDRARAVLDQGFTERTMAHLPNGPRKTIRPFRTVLRTTLIGALVTLSLPSGAGAMLTAMQDLIGGMHNINAALIVFVPLFVILSLGTVLALDEIGMD
nr:hypothetical protein [uncultured Undibacterium sp.]